MFSIGEFARFAGVSVRTVRYYDELGLLPPVFVDPATGYRSYGADQLARLHRIVALKELGCRSGSSNRFSMISIPPSSAGCSS